MRLLAGEEVADTAADSVAVTWAAAAVTCAPDSPVDTLVVHVWAADSPVDTLVVDSVAPAWAADSAVLTWAADSAAALRVRILPARAPTSATSIMTGVSITTGVLVVAGIMASMTTGIYPLTDICAH